MTVLAHKQQSLARPVRITGVAAHRASFAGVVGIYLHRHTARKRCLVGDVAVQLGKRPLGGMPVALAGFGGDLFHAFSMLLALVRAPFRSLTDVCQIFQADHTLWVLVYDAMTDRMVHSLFQPSLSSTDDDQASSSGTSAFLLQPFSQSRIVICFGPNLFASIECRLTPSRSCSHGKIALPNIHTYHLLVAFRCWLCYLNLKCYQQVELFARLVIPEFRGSDMRILLYESNVLVIARVGNNHTPDQGEDADLLIWFQAVVPMKVVGDGGRDILGWLIEALVALLGVAHLALCSVLPDLCPQRFVGGSYLAGNIAGHLSRQAILQAYLIIVLTLQSTLVAHLAMKKCVPAHSVQRIAVC